MSYTKPPRSNLNLMNIYSLELNTLVNPKFARILERSNAIALEPTAVGETSMSHYDAKGGAN